MAAEAGPANKRGRPSKTEVKMALVARRLAMLRSSDDDDDIDNDTLPVAIENPKKCESEKAKSLNTKTIKSCFANQKACGSENAKQARGKNLTAKQIKSSSANQKKPTSTKPKLEDMTPKSVANRRKHGRFNRMSVVSSEDSLEDRAFVEPKKKKRAMEKEDKAEDSSDLEASDNPAKHIIQSRDSMDDFNVKLTASKQAEEVLANLSDEYPSFKKEMLRSHVTLGFWLGLPSKFCDAHLPITDCTIVLVDEDGRECDTKFLAQKSGLSGGWRGFSLDHNLQEGDVVVFQLINPTTFKVYIVRAVSYGEVDGTLGLLNLDACAGQWISNPSEKVIQKEDSLLLLEENVQGSSDIDIEREMVDGIHFSETVICFEGIKSFEDFHMVVDGLVMDSKFSENIRKKYYKLCCCQGKFLHEHLLCGLNCTLVAGIICETVNIADAIKAYEESTCRDNLFVWEKTLKGFELLGMDVSFLLAPINLLLGLASESDMIDESSRLKEAKLEQARASERIMALEAKLLELKENMKEIDLELEAEVSGSARKRELQMKEKINAQW